VANCFATDQSSAFVEASLGNCCCQHQSIRNQSRQCRHPIRVRIAAVSCVSCVLVAYPKRIQSKYVKGMETNRLRYQAYRLRIGCVSKANTSKGWKRIDCGIKRISCVSKTNTPKGWKRVDCGIKRISCVLAAYPRCVVEAHDRQTDRL
jgi:hypothetical protein